MFRDGGWDEAVLKRTQLCLLDSLASFSGGLVLPHFKQSAAGMLRSLSGTGADPELSPFLIAYLYGQAAIAMDFDDSFYGHPGGPIVATLLAVGVERKLTLDQVLRGIAAGYEAHGILCGASDPTPEHAALVRSVGNLDTVAASIGAACALGYDAKDVDRLIGVAVAHTVIPYTAKWYERPVPSMKNNVGWIAAGAVLAIHLAEEGQTGATSPLQGNNGLWRMIGSDRWGLDDRLFEQKAAVLRTGFKRFPGCWWTQPYLKSFATLLERLEPGDNVKKVVVSATPDIEKFCVEALLGTADVAFSLPAMFRCQMEGIDPGPQWVLAEKSMPAPKIEYRKETSCRIQVFTTSDRILSIPVNSNSIVDAAEHGLSEEEVIAKFRNLTDGDVRRAGELCLLDERSRDIEPTELYHAVIQRLADLTI